MQRDQPNYRAPLAAGSASPIGVGFDFPIGLGPRFGADGTQLVYSGIDATDVMRIDVGTVTGSVTQLMVSITYTEND